MDPIPMIDHIHMVDPIPMVDPMPMIKPIHMANIWRTYGLFTKVVPIPMVDPIQSVTRFWNDLFQNKQRPNQAMFQAEF